MDSKLPPHSADAEYALLGALLRQNEAYDRVADVVSEKDFYVHRHKHVFRTIMQLIEAGKPADVVTVAEAMEGDDDLPYLRQIVMSTPSADNARHYAQNVRNMRIGRDLIVAADTMRELAYSHADINERLDQAQALLTDLHEGRLDNEPVLLRDVLSEVVADIDDRYRNQSAGITGLSTGLLDLDEKTAGLHNGDLIIIAGRPSMGKTALALQIGQQASLADKRVLVFSLEMSDRALVERALANAGRISSHALRIGKLQDCDWQRISRTVGELANAPLFIDEASSPTLTQMRAKARRLKRKCGLDLVVVDYIQLMEGQSGDNRRDNRNEELSRITRGLKLLAKDLDVPVIAVSQLSRKVEDRPDKRPIMSDLRESGAIEQDADLILFVYRDEYYTKEKSLNPGVAEVLIAKQRMGETGDVYLTWSGAFCRFDNHAGHYQRPETVDKLRPRGLD